MAFFSVIRYDEEISDTQKEDKSKNILLKLHEAAEKRRRSKHEAEESSPAKKVNLEPDADLDTLRQNGRSSSKRKRKNLNTNEIGKDEIAPIESEIKQKSTPKKLKQKKTSVDNLNDQENTGEKEIQKPLTVKDEYISDDEIQKPLTVQDEHISDDDKNEIDNLNEEDSAQNDKINEDDKVFPVLGAVLSKKSLHVHRVLPDWLSRPTIISSDIENRTPIDSVKDLHEDLVKRLNENGIKDLFPVQGALLPELLRSFRAGYLFGDAGFRPSDICCSAPTGSGKTLAYVLPLVQALKNRVVPQIRALIMVPYRDLVIQVHRVFKSYVKETDIKVYGITGDRPFHSEQVSLVKKGPLGFESKFDIIISTPGRLVDHINQTEGFNLKHLRFLVIDEADRVMEEISQDWLRYVIDAVYSVDKPDDELAHWQNKTRGAVELYGNIQRDPPGTMTADNACRPQLVLQKLLFSATLSQNPEKLQQLNLFQPKLFTSVRDKSETDTKTGQDENKGEYIGKFTTPAGLKELSIECEQEMKPLILMDLIQRLGYRQILCFTNSIEATHKLYYLLKFTCKIEVGEISSAQLSDRRKRILRQFANGKIDVIVCSDALARGMDISNVQYVISYDSPRYMESYIHRVGRTARAGRPGTAITFFLEHELGMFHHMLKEAGKPKIEQMTIDYKNLNKYVPALQEALKQLKVTLQNENRR